MEIKIDKRKKNRLLLLPKANKALESLGENIKLARLRRGWTAENLAERVGLTRATLHKMEKGESGVAIGYYAAVLFAFGFENELASIAEKDETGRRLQDISLTQSPAKKKRTEGSHDV